MILKKSSGDFWPRGDYRILSSAAGLDRYRAPHIAHFSLSPHGATIFSKIELVNAYHHSSMERPTVPRGTIITAFGLFEYIHSHLTSATLENFLDASWKQRLGVYPSSWLTSTTFVFSADTEQCLQHLWQLFHRLTEYGPVINTAKCDFGKSELNFLGHCVESSSIRSFPSKVMVIQDFLCEFVGLINFYRLRCIALLQPLMDKLWGTKMNCFPLTWSPAALDYFQAAKAKPSDVALLPCPGAP